MDPRNDPLTGATLCHATNNAGTPCRAPAMRGQKVCRVHGGSSPQAKAAAKTRLIAAQDPAISKLLKIMATAEKDADALRAIENILDRSGLPRGAALTVSDARDYLVDAIERIVQSRDDEGDG